MSGGFVQIGMLLVLASLALAIVGLVVWLAKRGKP